MAIQSEGPQIQNMLMMDFCESNLHFILGTTNGPGMAVLNGHVGHHMVKSIVTLNVLWLAITNQVACITIQYNSSHLGAQLQDVITQILTSRWTCISSTASRELKIVIGIYAYL